jgi:hypothetical protein
MLATLRDVYHAENISDLRYEASNSQTGGSWDASSLDPIPATAS